MRASCIYVCARMDELINACMCVCVCAFIYVCVYVCADELYVMYGMHACTVWAYACMSCMYACM